MNKLYIATAIAFTAITAASAEEGGMMIRATTAVGAPMMRGSAQAGVATEVRMMPVMTTGDAATDAQLKALTVEMEAKIKAIRDDYQVKIKALIGDKKIMPMMASTTPGAMRGEGRGERMNATASGTAMMQREGDDRREEGDQMGRPMMGRAEGEQGAQFVSQDFSARVQNFFKGIFGGNK
jgi:hypothetical protein